jgi:membrane protein YdbS with pleckstrin-like domain
VAINVAIERSLSKGQRYAELAQRIWVAMEAIGFVSLAAAIVFTFLALRLNYELRWYMVTDRSLRIRHGVWSVEELTMTYANIQEIRVSSGPLQNWLGLADVVVSAAGGGTTDKHGHTVGGHKATFEGVENANEIRDLIVERLRAYRDSGLGERPSVGAAGSAPDALEAAHELLDEARRLRATVAASGGRFALKDEPGR